MTREQGHDSIRNEMSAAHEARAKGNEGMVRVCARRAAGIAIAFWLQQHPRPWRADAVSRLRSIHTEPDLPESIRAAAGRLAARVRGDFTPAFPEDPLNDAWTIIGELFREP
jgi:hypothetical protein